MALEISTDRLRLRLAEPHDAPQLTALVADPRVHQRLANVPPGQSVDETAAFLAGARKGHESGREHVFVIEADGRAAGLVGLARKGPLLPYTLGYWLGADHWGRGYMTEAAGAVRDWAWHQRGERALLSGHFADNPASGRVLEKLDFMRCGRRPMASRARPAPTDHVERVWIA